MSEEKKEIETQELSTDTLDSIELMKELEELVNEFTKETFVQICTVAEKILNKTATDKEIKETVDWYYKTTNAMVTAALAAGASVASRRESLKRDIGELNEENIYRFIKSTGLGEDGNKGGGGLVN